MKYIEVYPDDRCVYGDFNPWSLGGSFMVQKIDIAYPTPVF